MEAINKTSIDKFKKIPYNKIRKKFTKSSSKEKQKKKRINKVLYDKLNNY